MHRILPAVVGAIVGALVVTMLLRDDGADDYSDALADTAQRTAASAAGTLLQAEDSGVTVTAITLSRLSAITDPSARREAALVALEINGNDVAAIDLIARSLPPIDAVNFRIHAIVKLAATDMRGALTAAMDLPEHEQRRLSLLRLAPALAELDPLGAIAAIKGFGTPDLENEFLAALFDAWAVRDPSRAFKYLESADDSRAPATEAAFEALAASDPERLLAIADELRRDIATMATTAALKSWMERDASTALTYIETLPGGIDRTNLEIRAAEAYGEQDPEAAWSWAADAQAGAVTMVSVVRGIHKVDPDLAWDAMLSIYNGTDAQLRAGIMQPYLMNYVNAVVNSESPGDVVIGLDRLLSLNDPRVDALMQTNLQGWADQAPEAALDWSLRNLDRINAGVLTRLSAGLARTDVDLARQTILRLDEEHRAAWATGVGRTLAETDLAAARNWAYELPIGSLRDAGLREVIRGEARGGSVDRQFFDQFSNDTARAEAANLAVRRLTCEGNKELAREIATSYITEQQLLEVAKRLIEDGSLNAGSAGCQFTR